MILGKASNGASVVGMADVELLVDRKQRDADDADELRADRELRLMIADDADGSG